MGVGGEATRHYALFVGKALIDEPTEQEKGKGKTALDG